MQFPTTTRTLLLALAIPALLAVPRTAAANPAMDWNEVAFNAVVTARQNPPMTTRSMAMVHAAMFDAVNAIQPRYRPFKFDGTPPTGASADAAAAAAAHTVLLKLFPEQRATFDQALARSLGAVPEGEARNGGVGVGTAAAQTLLDWCKDDGIGAPSQYRPVTRAGAYIPTSTPIGDDFAQSRPWLMTRVDQFRPAPPLALKSGRWAQDLNETRQVGARTGSTRSAEQTEVAQFWVVTGAPAYNAVIRQAIAQRNLDLADTARLMALTYMATTDALVAVFDAKYAYQFWRPVTAVRNADLSENFAIKRDPAWLPLVDAPMHPEYPCAHCISSTAVATVLQSALGDEMATVSMTSPMLPGVTRQWTRLSDYAQEVSNARVWSGVHYRFSAETGQQMGKEIANYAVRNYLQPR